ncbi:MAG TPA: alpha/beta fold hydrolase [Solirubrobacterales bacterium]|nr:alpha/beta fold hydrolase [Solirubrobacterales bacterium]
MPGLESKRGGGLSYREASPEGDSGGNPVLLVHGFPESSYMWRHLMPAIAVAGRRAIAPDLPGYGDSAPDSPGTWERHVEALERFRDAVGIERAALVVHDWGGLIGLRWACDNPGVTTAIVVSGTGFFPDGKWHGMANMLRTEGEGEQLVGDLDPVGMKRMLRAVGRGFGDQAIEEYFKAFTTAERRQGILDLYRSGDFEKLEPYRGKLAELGIPILALWGENDVFAPPAGAYRFRNEIPGTEVVVIEDAGHFTFEDAPERCAQEVVDFLGRAA